MAGLLAVLCSACGGGGGGGASGSAATGNPPAAVSGGDTGSTGGAPSGGSGTSGGSTSGGSTSGGATSGGTTSGGGTSSSGGTNSGGSSGNGGSSPTPQNTGPTEAQRVAAATATAGSNAACSSSALPEGFYWEIGDRDGVKASGRVAGTDTPEAAQVIAIASASKWIYASYVLQKTGSVRDVDLPFLNFTSGHVFPLTAATREVLCGPTETVGECAAAVELDASATGRFYYSAGHFQYHAANTMGLGALNASQLTAEVTTQVGAFDFVYLQTNLAGGLNASASGYAGFLRRVLRGELAMSSRLDANTVCATPACGAGAVLSPAPQDESWHYGLGHWVEDDPTVGDGAFSSAGALGFYPWIDASRTWYGVLARRAGNATSDEGVKSLRCGRLIRQAWATGATVTGATPTPSH